MFFQGWHHLRSSEGSASSLLRCSVISGLCKSWILTEALLPRDASPVAETEKQIRDNISVAAVPMKNSYSRVWQPNVKKLYLL